MPVSTPLVTIVTPAYNRAEFLRETIESVLSQRYPYIDYVVLDDGSTDGTREVLKTYGDRIIWETQANQGETRTVNHGLRMARGEILAVVNSDDPLLPGAVEEAVALLQGRPELLAVYPDWNCIDSSSQVLHHVQVSEYNYLRMVRRHDCIVGPGAFFRRTALDLVGYRDPAFTYVADFDYWLRLGMHGPFARIPKTLATFRVHPTSASAACRGAAMSNEHMRLAESFFARDDLPPEVRRVRREAFAWAHFVAGIAAGRARRVGAKHTMLAIMGHPWSVLPRAVLYTFPFQVFFRWRAARDARHGMR